MTTTFDVAAHPPNSSCIRSGLAAARPPAGSRSAETALADRDGKPGGLQWVVVLARSPAIADHGHDLRQGCPTKSMPRSSGRFEEYVRRSPHDGDAWMMLARSSSGPQRLRGLRPGSARGSIVVAHQGRGTPSRRAGLPADRPRQGCRDRLVRGDQGRSASPCRALRLYHDVCQELLTLYAIEDRWEDAFPVMWMAYDHANPVDYRRALDDAAAPRAGTSCSQGNDAFS